ncbi:MAG: cytochrome c peroxidase [Chlamydiales bacterium]
MIGSVHQTHRPARSQKQSSMKRNLSLHLLVLIGVSQAPAVAQLGAPPVPSENPMSESKRILGKALFWDEQLSSDNTMACGTCHIPSSGGSDPRMGPGSVHPGIDGVFGSPDDKLASPGVLHANNRDNFVPDGTFGFEPQVTGRRAPTMAGAAFFQSLFWDGRATGEFVNPETGTISIAVGGALESQAVGPILSSVEMAHAGRTWDDVRTKLEAARPLALAWDLPADLAAALAPEPSYGDLFADAFGDPDITAERIGFAIATYERTLIPNQTPWDQFQAGNTNALTAQQVQGMNAFNGGARCNQCHSGPLFSDGQFRNIGVRPLVEDRGRQEITGNPGDRGRFKVPTLRNVELRGRWFHNGAPPLANLNAVVNFYRGGGGPFDNNKDPILDGLNFPPQVATNITAFLRALTDPRVENELAPFDRPQLNSERPVDNPRLVGSGVPGAGGIIPQPIAVVPPNLGNEDFKIGVRAGRGGATAYLRWSMDPTQPGRVRGTAGLFDISPRRIVRLAGAGPGEGFATFHVPMPNDPALIGVRSFMHWVVLDPAAPMGRARTQPIELSFF